MVLKDWSQKLNSKESNAARDSAIAATADSEKVAARGHKFSDNVRFPIVLGGYSEDGENFDIESLPLEKATKKFIAMMESIGLGEDLTRASERSNIRAGKRKMRRRRRRTPPTHTTRRRTSATPSSTLCAAARASAASSTA